MTQQVLNTDGDTVHVVDDADLLAWFRRALGWLLTAGVILVGTGVANWVGLNNRVTQVERAQAEATMDKRKDTTDLSRLVKTTDSLVVVLQGLTEEIRSDGRRRR